LIINNNIELAMRAGANGVHLGRYDRDVERAQRRLPNQLLGVSCYNQLDRARDAIAAGADAVAFGSIFESVTKPAAVRAPLALVSEARATWPQRRIIAIGGIAADNVATVAAAGAHAVAVLDAIFGAENPAAAVRELIRRFDQGKIRHDEQRTTI
jgi:thiamine-phosphate pyrophosphorylase